MNAQQKKTAEDFFKAIISLKDMDECADFFSDMCTSKEVLSIAQRYTVAKMLKERRVYSEIVKETGASTATVSRVKRVLSDGTGAVSNLIERNSD